MVTVLAAVIGVAMGVACSLLERGSVVALFVVILVGAILGVAMGSAGDALAWQLGCSVGFVVTMMVQLTWSKP